MPSFNAHCKVSKELFGKSYWRIHKWIDSAYPILGRSHRRYFHDDMSAMGFALSLYPGDPGAVEAARFHLVLDEMCSADPAFKKYIEAWAKKRVKRRNPKKKVKTRELLPDVMEQLFKNFKKMAEVARLKKLIKES